MDLATILAEIEAIVVRLKAMDDDGKVTPKEILGLIGAIGKLAAHAAKLL